MSQLTDKHISRAGLLRIAQEIELIKSRLQKIEDIVVEEQIKEREDERINVADNQLP